MCLFQSRFWTEEWSSYPVSIDSAPIINLQGQEGSREDGGGDSSRASETVNINQFKEEISGWIIGMPSSSRKATALITLVLYRNLANMEDVRSFCQYVCDGTFYEYIKAQLISRGYEVPADRGKLKEMVFQTMFTSNRFKGQPEAKPKRIFEEIFPNVAEVFSLIKTKKSNVLPILLQSIESYLFLQVISKRISSEFPGLPIFTVHDSIITLKGHEDKIEQIMIEELTRAIGLPPKISVEYLSVENLEAKRLELSEENEHLDVEVAQLSQTCKEMYDEEYD